MKAQFWSFDIIFAIVIFIFAVVLLTYVWINISGEFAISSGQNIAQLESELQTIGTQLISQGSPTNWYTKVNLGSPYSWSNVSIGLGNGTEGALSIGKISTLENMSLTDYQETKPSLGIAYDYYITINGTDINIAIGHNPAITNVTAVQVLTEPVVVNGRPAEMQIELWSNSTLGIE